MALDRTEIEAVLEKFHELLADGDTEAWGKLFSEDCQFRTSFTPEPIIGRDQLRVLAASWPKVVNQHEWYAIDGNRLVLAWNERLLSMKESTPPYRGMSTVVFDESGLIREYEGVFDTAAVAAALNG
jgi:hypothetical protein